MEMQMLLFITTKSVLLNMSNFCYFSVWNVIHNRV